MDTARKEMEIEKKIKEGEQKDEPSESKKPSAASIFGGAKPVDTAAKEREIEEKLKKEREAKTDDRDGYADISIWYS